MKYTSIDIIYNPESTGSSHEHAQQLHDELKKAGVGVPVSVHPTKYARHAIELAYELATKSTSPLLISSSGDGGYNEVINGAMKAQNEGARPICAVLPAGNANDHSRTLGGSNLLESILSNKVKAIDLLKMEYVSKSKQHIEYAHSYIGLGLTPVVATELNKTSLNALKELWIVLKTFYKLRPSKIHHKGKVVVLDSMIFANINQMAKVLSLATESKPDDGLFEVVAFPHTTRLNLVKVLTKATVASLDTTNQAKVYEFTAIKKMPVQLDGEVRSVDKNTRVKISCEKRVLRTVL